MGISTLIEKIQKELKNIWFSETTLPDYVPGGFAGRTIPKNQVSVAVFIILTLILAGIFWNAAANTDTVSLPGGGGGANVELDNGALDPRNGHSDENTEQSFNLTVDEATIAEITFTLTWEDEEPMITYENDPDEFQLEVSTPWGANDTTAMTPNGGNGQGEISLEFQAPGTYPDTGSAGDYDVTVRMGDAGDQSFIGLGSGIIIVDSGNDWTLTVTFTYWKEATEPIQEE